jgi:hypothetical protein
MTVSAPLLQIAAIVASSAGSPPPQPLPDTVDHGPAAEPQALLLTAMLIENDQVTMAQAAAPAPAPEAAPPAPAPEPAPVYAPAFGSALAPADGGPAIDADEALIEGRRRPGVPEQLPEKIVQENPGAVAPPPPEAFPVDQIPVPDRWRLIETLGVVKQRWFDPYNQNFYKGDRPISLEKKPSWLPIKGDDWFLVLNGISDTIVEPRSFPTPVNRQLNAEPGAVDVFGRQNSLVLAQTFIAGAALIKGSTAFKPPDVEYRITLAYNVNYVDVEERRVLSVRPSRPTHRLDDFLGIGAMSRIASISILSASASSLSRRISGAFCSTTISSASASSGTATTTAINIISRCFGGWKRIPTAASTTSRRRRGTISSCSATSTRRISPSPASPARSRRRSTSTARMACMSTTTASRCGRCCSATFSRAIMTSSIWATARMAASAGST